MMEAVKIVNPIPRKIHLSPYNAIFCQQVEDWFVSSGMPPIMVTGPGSGVLVFLIDLPCFKCILIAQIC